MQPTKFGGDKPKKERCKSGHRRATGPVRGPESVNRCVETPCGSRTRQVRSLQLMRKKSDP